MNNETISDKRLNFFINNPDVFNKLVESMTRNTNMYMTKITRSDVKKSFSCKNTQFLLVSLCYINNPYVDDFILNYHTLPKKSSTFENIVQEIGTYYSNLFYNLRPIPNPIKSAFGQFNELTELSNLYQSQYNLFSNKSVFDTGNYIICPLCLYTIDTDSNIYSIEHYFTLIHDKQTGKYYINSSYGDDKICVMNDTNEIQEDQLTTIIDIFKDGMNEENYDYAVEFIKYYFLPKISDRLVNEQMNNLKKSKIGIINRYFNILDNSVVMAGGKKYKKRHNVRSKSKRKTFRRKTTKRKTFRRK